MHLQLPSDSDNSGQEAERLITKFRKEILLASSSCHLMQCLQNSINACQLEDADAQAAHASNIFPGTLHCEAVLAAIGEYPDRAILDKNETLIKIAQVLASLRFSHNWSDWFSYAGRR